MGGSGREELEMAFPFPCSPTIHQCLLKENPDRKKKEKYAIKTGTEFCPQIPLKTFLVSFWPPIISRFLLGLNPIIGLVLNTL